MKDVAERAGVSIKTVSRVLNDEPHVHKKVRRKVRAAAEALDYLPSRSARSLRGTRSYDLSLICHQASNHYARTIQFGAVLACQDSGYQLSISLLENLQDRTISEIRRELEALVRRRKPDGVILLAPYANDEKLEFVLQEMSIPAARVGPVDQRFRGIVVEIDDYQASIDLVNYLIGLGHREIGFICGAKDQRATQVRFAGFSMAMEAAGIGINPEWIAQGNFDFDSGFDAGQRFLAMPELPTAIFASNDDMAAGVIAALLEGGVSVPTEVSVVGFDDADVATRMRPLLTTIRQPLDQIGRAAVRELVRYCETKPEFVTSSVVLDHELIVRDSADRACQTNVAGLK